MTDTADGLTHLVPVTKVFSNDRREVEVSFPQRVVADLDDALLEQPLHVPVTERETVVQPSRLLDDADRESVVAGLTVSPPPCGVTRQNHRTLLMP